MLIAASPPPNRYALSTEFCRRIGWVKPDGGLKDMMARVTMLAMHRDGRRIGTIGLTMSDALSITGAIVAAPAFSIPR